MPQSYDQKILLFLLHFILHQVFFNTVKSHPSPDSVFICIFFNTCKVRPFKVLWKSLSLLFHHWSCCVNSPAVLLFQQMPFILVSSYERTGLMLSQMWEYFKTENGSCVVVQYSLAQCKDGAWVLLHGS